MATDDVLDLTKARAGVLTATTEYVGSLHRLLDRADAVTKAEATLCLLAKLPGGRPLFCGDKSTGLRSHTDRNIIAAVGQGLHDAMKLTLGFDMQSTHTFTSAPVPASGPEGATAQKKPRAAWVHNPTGMHDTKWVVPSLLPENFDISSMTTLPACMLVGMESADPSAPLGKLLEVLMANLVKFFILSTGVCQQAMSGARVMAFLEQMVLLISVAYPTVPPKRTKSGEMRAQEPMLYYRRTCVSKFHNFRGASTAGQVRRGGAG